MILYHVSSDIAFDGSFENRIPFELADNENDTILRTCAAPTLEQCLASIGCWEATYKVFTIDTEKLGISEEDMKTPYELDEKGLVPDALFQKEHWITKNFIVPKEDHMLIEVIKWNEDFLSYDKDTDAYVSYEENKELCSGVVIFDLKYQVLQEIKK